ncbi:MAG TPA: tripartite tricarboxylate transporter substrate binding protein [Burkholderiaceae bacterium]|nr:tripartite tricarboxylate transporter substrate binding protein [Burkholderiaceae bacterium]
MGFRLELLGLLVLLSSPLATLAAPAPADAYPTRAVTLIVPYPPGGSTDAMARVLVPLLSEHLGQPVRIENRGGASGAVGSSHAARQPADGYTILLGTDATHAANVHLSRDYPYHPIDDFTPLTLAAINVLVLVVHPSLPVKNVTELIAHARANAAQPLRFASSGAGSPHHLAGELLAQRGGIRLEHMAYKGGGPAVADVLSGQIPMLFASAASVMPHLQAGTLRAIAVTDAQRFAGLPDVPTLSETLPGLEMTSWLAFFGPPKLPDAIIRRLHAALVTALRAPEVRAKLETQGLRVVAGSPQQLAEAVRRDYTQRQQLIDKLGLTVR